MEDSLSKRHYWSISPAGDKGLSLTEMVADPKPIFPSIVYHHFSALADQKPRADGTEVLVSVQV
jgi:hypothetical protein